jgi:hypothetical protein
MMSKPPAAVTTLLWMVLFLTTWNAIRLGAAIIQWKLLLEFASRPGPLYIALSAAFWTLAGLALWITIRRRSPRTRPAAAVFVIGYAAWWWIDRLVLQAPRPNWPFALVITIILLILTAIGLFNRKTTAYFSQRESHEQPPSDQ